MSWLGTQVEGIVLLCNAEDFIVDLAFEIMSNLLMKGKLFLCSHNLLTITGSKHSTIGNIYHKFSILKGSGSNRPRVNLSPRSTRPVPICMGDITCIDM